MICGRMKTSGLVCATSIISMLHRWFALGSTSLLNQTIPPAERAADAPVDLGELVGQRAEDRAGVKSLLQLEDAGAGDLVAVEHGVLHGGSTAPGGQEREVQVDPAEAGDLQRRLRHQGAVGHDGGRVVFEGPPALPITALVTLSSTPARNSM